MIKSAESYRTMSLETVTIHLADTETAVYKDLLCAVSPYFQKALKGPFIEAQTQSITLHDVDKRVFRVFLQWVHIQAFSHRGSFGPTATHY